MCDEMKIFLPTLVVNLLIVIVAYFGKETKLFVITGIFLIGNLFLFILLYYIDKSLK